MARIALLPGGIPSKLITEGELGARLQRAGFAVTMVLPADSAKNAAGLKCVQYALSLDAAAPRDTVRESRQRRIERCREAASAADHDGFKNCLAAIRPDLVLIDIEAHAEIMAAVQAGFRVGLVNVFFNLWKHNNVPPVHVPITPGVGLAGTRAGIEWSWLRYRAWRWLELRRCRRNGDNQLTRLEAFAERLRFPLAREVDYYQGLLPYLYRRLPILNTNILELDLPHTPHENSHYVGPMINVDRGHFDFASEEQVIAEEITAIANSADKAGDKLVYCAFGAYFPGDDSPFLQRVVAAAAMRPDWRFVLGLGRRLKPADLGLLPQNVFAFHWAPQMHALQHADVAIVHGGMTTVYECIHFGVPMVTYPYTTFDQVGTAARVRYHGVGVCGDRHRDTPAEIVSHVERALSDRGIRARVATMRDHIERYRAEDRLADAVSAFIAGADNADEARTAAPLPRGLS